MSRSDRQDLDIERGDDISTGTTGHPAMTSLSSRVCEVDCRLNQSQLIQPPPLQSYQGEINYGDGSESWSLYAMYSEVTQEEDNKVAERSLKAADSLLVFVSPYFTPLFLHTSI